MTHKKFFSLAELAEITEAKLVGDPEHLISNVADLESAETEDASFLSNPRYEKAMHASRAGVIFINGETPVKEGKNYLVTGDPSRAFQVVLEAFMQEAGKLTGFKELHPTAVVHPTASLGKDVTVGPHAVIDQDASIGDGCKIGAGTYIGPNVTIGTNCTLHPNAVIRERCTLGNNVILQPGAVIGSCGFGYTTGAEGKHLKLNQVGTVALEDDVEVGANSSIDRSRFKSTVIGKGTKIDNQVQIGHGVKIGSHSIIVSQVGIAGSTEIGSHVIIAGQVGIAGHIKICDQVMIAAKSGVTKPITKPGKYGGAPCVPAEEFGRNIVLMRNIGKFADRIKNIEARLDKLEN